MDKHTPAPWTMERNEGYLINGVIHVPDVYEEHHADARLIAAAPQLLEACERARDELLISITSGYCRFCSSYAVYTGDGTIYHPIEHQSSCVIAALDSALVAAHDEP